MTGVITALTLVVALSITIIIIRIYSDYEVRKRVKGLPTPNYKIETPSPVPIFKGSDSLPSPTFEIKPPPKSYGMKPSKEELAETKNFVTRPIYEIPHPPPPRKRVEGGFQPAPEVCECCVAICCDICEIPKTRGEKTMNNQIENNYTYHAPTEGDIKKYTTIREKAKEFAYLIDNACPNSREKSLAHTNLEQAVMWANASIARN